MIETTMVFVGGTYPGYQGRLDLIQCDCCRGVHKFWWSEGMARICDYCFNDEDAPDWWKDADPETGEISR